MLLSSFQEGAIKVKDLSLPELIGIIDTCFCCLVSFTVLNNEIWFGECSGTASKHSITKILLTASSFVESTLEHVFVFTMSTCVYLDHMVRGPLPGADGVHLFVCS